MLKFNIIKEELIMINKLKAFINGITAVTARVIACVSKEKIPVEHNDAEPEHLERRSQNNHEASADNKELTNMYVRYFILKVIILIFEILVILDYLKVLPLKLF